MRERYEKETENIRVNITCVCLLISLLCKRSQNAGRILIVATLSAYNFKFALLI